MKVLLINPNKLLPKDFNLTQKSSPPLGLALIASIFKQEGFHVEVFDFIAENAERVVPFCDDIIVQGESIENFFINVNVREYDIIGFTLMFTNNWLANRELINQIKSFHPDCLTIAGGEHVSALPEFCLKTCDGLDFVVKGEGEGPLIEFCNSYKNQLEFKNITGLYSKTTKPTCLSKPNRLNDIELLPIPSWELFPLEKYQQNKLSYGVSYDVSLPLIATRGCPYDCTFCSSPDMWGRSYKMRTVQSVVNEIDFLVKTYNVSNVDFFDLTAIIKKEWIVQLCKEIIKRDIKITYQIPAGTRAEAIDFEVASLLKASGCKNITYAPESGSIKMLKDIRKKVNLNSMLKSIKESNDAGLKIKLNIIIGYPNEKAIDILKTLFFLIKASFYGAHDTSPSIFNPYPGSKIFNDLYQSGKIKLNDEYFLSVVHSESFHGFTNYNQNIKKWQLIFFQYLIYASFYFSNYLFRPARFFKLIKSLFTGIAETRGEWMLVHILSQKRKANI